MKPFPFNEGESSPQYQAASNIHHQRGFKASFVIISNYMPFINEFCPYPPRLGEKSRYLFGLFEIAPYKTIRHFASLFALSYSVAQHCLRHCHRPPLADNYREALSLRV